jgi:hypothetical protein
MAINDWNDSWLDDQRRFFGYGSGYPFEPYGQFERFSRFERFPRGGTHRGEHAWRGGVLGWLGAGVRAGAGWFGDRLQNWGAWFGGRLSGRTAEIGRAVRGRGEQMASTLENQDERAAAALGRRNPRYRRPDERILDDVWHRISLAAVDPQEVDVEVNDGVVTLSGRVSTRFEKRILEDIADGVFGVQEVHNHLRLARIAGEPSVGTTPAAEPVRSPIEKSFDGNPAQPERH